VTVRVSVYLTLTQGLRPRLAPSHGAALVPVFGAGVSDCYEARARVRIRAE